MFLNLYYIIKNQQSTADFELQANNSLLYLQANNSIGVGITMKLYLKTYQYYPPKFSKPVRI